MRVAPLVLAVVVLTGACDGSGTQTPPLDPPSVDPTPSGSACDAVTVGGATAQRFEVNGSCVPGDVMVLYRCAPADVPVLRISSAAGPAIFLGGPFAVPVRTLPAQVRFAGSGDGTEVLIADPLPPSPSPTPVTFDRLARVQPHAHSEVDDGVVAQLLLSFDRGRRCVGGGRERGAEAVATGAEHVPAVTLDGVPHDRVVDPQRIGHVGRVFVPPTGGILDVGEQKGHRAPREPARHTRTVTRRRTS